jgi:sulfoquinovose isomerase
MSTDPVIPTAELSAEYHRLLEFGRRFPHPDGGAAWLGNDATPMPDRPIATYMTARMAHVYLLGSMTGFAGADARADVALAALDDRLRDGENGGWFKQVGGDEEPDLTKDCYAHAFVVLAASTATVAGHPIGRRLLDEALDIWLGRFWEEPAGMFLDAWDRSFSHADGYRGMNANMHGVEALLAAADATGDPGHLAKARRVADRMIDQAETHGWRIPEHYTATWTPELDYNTDHPDDPFKPFGATVGHALEWSRLLLDLEAMHLEAMHLAAIGGAEGGEATDTPQPDRLVRAARSLFDRAVSDGWAADGADGFVYTTDFDGKPVVHDRLHWVVCEGIAAAAAVHRRTGDEHYADLARQWWAYAKANVLDLEQGSWHHQLDRHNRPITSVWAGKPDLYHAVQAMLLPQLPLAPGLAKAVHGGLLESQHPGSAG